MVLLSFVLSIIKNNHPHKIFLTFFHVFFCVFYLLVACYGSFLDFSKIDTDDPFARAIIDYPYGFLTNWNVFGHILYALLSVFIDIQDLKESQKFKTHLHYLQGYLFNAILVPYTLFVSYMFWSLYFYDKSLIMPEQLTAVITPTFNHCLHTFILIPLAFELCFNPVYTPSHKKVLIGYTIYQVLYWIVLVILLYGKVGWMYKVFAILPFWTRLLYATVNFFTGLLMYFGFYHIQKLRWRFNFGKQHVS